MRLRTRRCLWPRLIQEDQIEVLIDLAGDTMGNRMDLFGLKATPIQASGLGYPETTGLPTVDYKIADRIVFPEREGGQYSSERILRLPENQEKTGKSQYYVQKNRRWRYIIPAVADSDR